LRPIPSARTAKRRRWSLLKRNRRIAELLSQHSILFSRIVDDLFLPLIHPSGNRHEQELKGIEHSRHLFSSDSPKTLT
jgi:hypothetical protein